MKKCLVFFLILLNACTPAASLPSASLKELEIAPTAAALDWITIYFSEPEAPNAGSYRGGPDAELAAAIAHAERSIDVAIHDLNLWSIRDALLDAYRRGVNVRLIFESDNLNDRSEIRELVSAGIPYVEDAGPGRMHNKFIIIDGFQLWTGSMNFTTTGAYRNRNNLILVESPVVASHYEDEFDEMFLAGDFGVYSPAGTGFLTALEGHSLEIYFSPDDNTLDRLLELVNGAQKSVHFLAFSFTADELADALLEAEARGVEVRGVFEGSQVASNTGGEWGYLNSKSLEIRQDGQRGEMHHKVLIIDGAIVVTGSYNFSRSAEERNDENTLVISSSELAAEFENEFQEIWQLAE